MYSLEYLCFLFREKSQSLTSSSSFICCGK